MEKRLVQAAFVAPMDQPMIRDGAVVVANGRIVEVGDATALRISHPSAEVVDLESSIILPGLINAHTHLELSACKAGKSPGGSFVDWILSLGARIDRVHGERDIAFTRGVETGVKQCLRFGVTTVGDISQQFTLTRPILRRSPIRAISYGEALGLGSHRPLFDALIEGATESIFASDRLRMGLSPHAPYTVDAPGYQRALQLARAHHLPLCTHLAETPEETEFLLHQTGPFRKLWEGMGLWTDDIPLHRAKPIQMAKALNLLDFPTLLAHVNYCDDEDLATLAQGNASVVFCPRTHRYFGHPPHRWREMLTAGVNVAVGTDSCASSPDLNIVDDLRLLHQQAPEVPAHTLWQLITTHAARALQWQDEIGSLTPDKSADLIAFRIESPDPLTELLENQILPHYVMNDER